MNYNGMTIVDGNKRSEPREITVQSEFFSVLSECSGELVKVPNYSSLLGEDVCLSTHYQYVNSVPPHSGMVVVAYVKDTFTGEYLPVGHRDWKLEVDAKIENQIIADGSHSVFNDIPAIVDELSRCEFSDKNGIEISSRKLVDLMNEDFGLEEISKLVNLLLLPEGLRTYLYQKRGIGKLMTLISAYVLKQRGVKCVQFKDGLESIAPEAQGIWKSFGSDMQTDFEIESIINSDTAASIRKTLFP